MKYTGLPMGMWFLFKNSFQRNLTTVFDIDKNTAKNINRQSKEKYRKILTEIPEFEKGDRFKMNIVSCAMLSAFLLNMPVKPNAEKAAEYYSRAMMTPFMRWFCRKSGKKKFSSSDIESMKTTADRKDADRNPYSWNMDYYPYEDGSGYEGRFTKCGICTLMKKLELFEYVPAMCKLDYTMSEAGGVSDFVRTYTLASGGPYCDCGYKKKNVNHLPTYGVGPIYGIIIIALTIAGIILTCEGYFRFAYTGMTKIPFTILGILIAICGFMVWFKGAFRIDHYIEKNELCTDGIYGMVRNPCYSGIMLMCNGALFLANNITLLILPIIYWLFMTILMKNTEEKWLYQLYGESYKEYCKKVNRCIPWFATKENKNMEGD